jgi:hypothetical protein
MIDDLAVGGPCWNMAEKQESSAVPKHDHAIDCWVRNHDVFFNRGSPD